MIGLSLVCTGLYAYFAYFLQRSDFFILVLLEVLLFVLTYVLIRFYRNKFWLLAGTGIIFRLVFLESIPVLSQDFYRFIWDGRLILQGINPYLFTPEAFLQDSTIGLGQTIFQAQELYNGMGSLNGSHFSNYPPVNQFFFALAALISGKSIWGSVLVMRIIIILADIGILYFGRKLLVALRQNPTHLFWYFLHPFVIIEMTGNLHFESVMLFFLVWSLYLLYTRKPVWAAVLFGLSVSVKLIPLLFLPLFFQWFFYQKNKQKGLLHLLGFYGVVLLTVGITFLPFYSSQFISNFGASLALWFQNFEFNASIYYLIRWIGYQTVGWNIIAIAGKILPIVVVLFVLIVSFFRNNRSFPALLSSMVWIIAFYFLMATTVHPWYLATVLLLSVFTRYTFAVVWSLMIVLSYSAYQHPYFSENLWLIALEYGVVTAVFIWDLVKKESSNSITQSPF